MGLSSALLFLTFYLTRIMIHSHSHPQVDQQGLHILGTRNGFEQPQQERPYTLKNIGRSARAAPLDINDNVGHTLELISQLVGTLGGSASGLVMGLTGISITDCAGSLKGKDLNKLTCEQFLNTIAQCDSLQNLKPYIQKAKQKYKKNPNKNAACFKNKPKRNGRR